MKQNVEQYLYSVGWSDDDDAFIAHVAEFPLLAAHGETQEKALIEIKEVVKFVMADLKRGKEFVPEPLGRRSYSGRLVLRMPKNLHRRLAAEAEQQGMSLNQLLNRKLEVNA